MSRKITEGVDYTSRDYSTIKQSLLDKLSQIMPEYTDRSETDAGIVILELLASALDSLHYYNDRVANEMFLSSLELEENALKWCEILGYSPRSATSAEFMQTFVAPYTIEEQEVIKLEPYVDENGETKYTQIFVTENKEIYSDKDTIIPKGTIVKTEETIEKVAVYFETAEELVIPKGTKSANVRIVEGVSQTEVLGTSDGSKAQRFYIKYDSIVKDSIKVYVTNISEDNNGVVEVWERVDDFFNSSSTDKHFRVVSWNNTTIVIFGDGSNGCIPPKNAQISSDYRVGGGIQGNVEPLTINTIVSQCDAVETYNAERAVVLGKDSETLSEIKVNAPRHNRTKWGAITLEDFADVVLTHFSEVKFAKAVRSSTNIDDVDIYVLSQKENPNRVDAVNKVVNFFIKADKPIDHFAYTDETGNPVSIQFNKTPPNNGEPYYFLANEELSIYKLCNIPYTTDYSSVEVTYIGSSKRLINLQPLFSDNYSLYNCTNNSWDNYYVFDPIDFNAGGLGSKIEKLFKENPDTVDDSDFGYKAVGTGDVKILCAKPLRLNVAYKLIVGYSYDPTTVDRKVKEAIESYFALGAYPIGETIYSMDLVRYVMQNVEGVSSFFPTLMSLAVSDKGVLSLKSERYDSDVSAEMLVVDSYEDDLTVKAETLATLDASMSNELGNEGVLPLAVNEVPLVVSIDSQII